MSGDAKKEGELLKTDIYGILGVQKDATDSEIKKAYRKLALKLHPDKCQDKDAPERFHKLQEAYDFIMEPGKNQKLVIIIYMLINRWYLWRMILIPIESKSREVQYALRKCSKARNAETSNGFGTEKEER